MKLNIKDNKQWLYIDRNIKRRKWIMSDRDNVFFQRVDTYKTILKDSMRQSPKDNKPLDADWLKIIYKEYHKRFLHDNNRIWLSGQIMIPLSLAPFVALANMPAPNFIKLLLLAVVSLTLIWLWLVVAETHKAFQQKSLALITAIEEILNINTRTLNPRINTDPLQGLFVHKYEIIPWVRRALAVCMTVIWAAVLFFKTCC